MTAAPTRSELLAITAELVTTSVAAELAGVFGDEEVFPHETVVDPQPDGTTWFPGWSGEVLVLAHEHDRVCTWGLAIDGDDAGAVIVGGDLPAGETTVVHARSLAAHLEARRWDGACLAQEPRLAAQAGPLAPDDLAALAEIGRARTPTSGWPYATTHRIEIDGVRILLWADPDCCDWWISGSEDALRAHLPRLVGLSDLRTALWSDDEAGNRLLAEVRTGA